MTSKKITKLALYRMRGVSVKRRTVAVRSTVLVIEPLQNSKCGQAARKHYQIKNAHGVEFVKGMERVSSDLRKS